MLRILFLFLLVISLGCGGGTSEESGSRLTRQQRDSVLSESKLPGAGTVGKAISVSDSASARARRLDDQAE